MDNERILATQELHQKLHKDVQDVGFVDIAHRIADEGPLRVYDWY